MKHPSRGYVFQYVNAIRLHKYYSKEGIPIFSRVDVWKQILIFLELFLDINNMSQFVRDALELLYHSERLICNRYKSCHVNEILRSCSADL